ncbi:MAG TPA: hypothetical protein G4O08_01075, partial [Anaerolineae bacterium]|nr:hypothetical protein [Anaerolineae bacterium]
MIDDFRGFIAQFQSISLQWKILFLLVILLILLNGIGSLLPPFSDAAGFYMSIAKITAASHRLLPMRGYFEAFSQIGLTAELHYTSLISLGSVEIAKEFNWLVGMAIVVMVAEITSMVGIGRKGKGIAAVMVLTSTAITHIIMNGKTDLFAASLGIAAFYWALEWREYKQRHPVWLAGMFTGMAVIAKLSYAAVLVPAIFLLIAWRLASWRVEDLSARALFVQVARTFLALGLGMALMAIPHILKSSLLFGQPLAPFYNTAGPAYLSSPRWFPPDETRRLVLTYPVALILGYTAMQGGQLSPLLLAFLPLAFLLRKPSRFFSSPLVQLTLSALAGVIVWVVMTPSVLAPRFILAPVLMFIPILAKGTEFLFLDETRSRLLKGGAFFVLLVSILFSMISVGIYAKQAIQIQAGWVDPCEYNRTNCWALSSL